MGYNVFDLACKKFQEIVRYNSLVDCKDHYRSVSNLSLGSAISEIEEFISNTHQGNSLYFSLLLVQKLYYMGITSTRLATYDEIHFGVYFVYKGQSHFFDAENSFKKSFSSDKLHLEDMSGISLYGVITLYEQRLTLARYLSETVRKF